MPEARFEVIQNKISKKICFCLIVLMIRIIISLNLNGDNSLVLMLVPNDRYLSVFLSLKNERRRPAKRIKSPINKIAFVRP